MKFINIEVNGKEYTLVDEFDDCYKDKIYCFAGDEDNIFCFKVNEKYIPIKDKKLIRKVKEKHNLMPSDIIYDAKTVIDKSKNDENVKKKTENKQLIDSESKEKFVDEVIEALKNNVPNFNEKSSRKRLENVKIYVIEEMPHETTRAFYRFTDNAMYFSKDDIEGNKEKNKRTRLHETIHALYGPDLLQKIASDKNGFNRIALEKFDQNSGLLEGATEDLVESIYAGDKDKIFQYPFEGTYNLSEECTYIQLVSIIRQIKYITGMETTEFLFDGNNKIIKELAEKCGKDCTRYIRYESTAISRDRDDGQIRKRLDKIQNYLLYSFDKEAEQVTNIQQADQFMNRLKNFEKIRVTVSFSTTFEAYYKNKLRNFMDMLEQDNNLSKDEKDNFAKKYEYKNWIIELYDENEEIRSQIQEKNLSKYVMRDFIIKEFDSYEQIPKDFFNDVKVFRKVQYNEYNEYNEYYMIKKSGKKVDIRTQNIKECVAVANEPPESIQNAKEEEFEEVSITKEVADKILKDVKEEFERLEKWREEHKEVADIDENIDYFYEEPINEFEPVKINSIFDKIKIRSAISLSRNDILMKIPFVKYFVYKSLNVLPSKNATEVPNISMKTKRNKFLCEISGNNKYKNFPQINNEKKEEQKENAENQNAQEDDERI